MIVNRGDSEGADMNIIDNSKPIVVEKKASMPTIKDVQRLRKELDDSLHAEKSLLEKKRNLLKQTRDLKVKVLLAETDEELDYLESQDDVLTMTLGTYC